MNEWMDGYDHDHERQISFHGFTKFFELRALTSRGQTKVIHRSREIKKKI